MLRLVRSAEPPRAGLQQGAARPRPRRVLPDFYWPAYGLIVETDGWEAHRTLAAFRARPRQGRRAHRRRLQGPAVHLGRRRRHHPAPPEVVASELTHAHRCRRRRTGRGRRRRRGGAARGAATSRRPRCAQRRRARRLGLGVRGGRARRRRRARRAGRRVLLDRDGRLDRRQQGRRDPRRAVRRRATAAGARKWNDANVLALSLRTTSEAELGEILDAWFAAGAERRARRRGQRRAPGRHPVIALNARAAARPELGGVERWARELAARLPALGGYEVIRPPAALVAPRRARVGAGRAAGAGAARGLLLNPANLAPLAFPRNAVVIHDAAALRHPGWYSPLYARWQRGVLPLIAPPRAARHHRQRVLQARAARSCCASTPQSSPAASTPASHPTADPEPASAALGLSRPYVLTVASRTRAQEPRLPSMPRPGAWPRRHRSRRRRRRAAAVPRRGAARRGPRARPRPRRPPPGPLRGSQRLRPALLARGLRPDLHRGDGLRRARRGGPRRRPARDLR